MTTEPAHFDLSIVIVNWNSVRHLRPCLTSIYRWIGEIGLEVVVIDNASYDGSADLVASEFPQARFVQSAENLGFARANNLAVAHSRGGALLFLNPDTELTDDAALIMLRHITANSRVGAVGCCVVNSDLTLQRTYTQAFPTVINQVLGADALQHLFPRSRLWGLRPMLDYTDRPMEVEVLSGSCIMMRRAVFEEVGRFSDQYYMYGDDVDLCYKVRHAGYSVQYIGSHRIVHHGGTSAAFRRENDFVTVMQKESIFRFLKVTKGSVYAASYRAAIAAAAMARVLLLLAIAPVAMAWMGREGLAGAGRKWWSVLRWAAGLEGWAARAG